MTPITPPERILPTNATIGPMIAASEYAGEVDASPMTIELTKPMAPGLSVASGCVPSDCVAMVPSWPGPDGPLADRGRIDGADATPARPQSVLFPGCFPVGAHTVTELTHLR